VQINHQQNSNTISTCTSVYEILYKTRHTDTLKVRLICIAHIHERSLRCSGIARIVNGYHSFICTPCISSTSGMSHICLCLPSRTWYSFTDPVEMEGSVYLGASSPGRDSNLQLPDYKTDTTTQPLAVNSHFLVFRLDALAKALSVIATATWLGGCHTPVLYQNR